MKNMILMVMAVAALGLVGCQTTGGQKQTWGTGLGALAGGLAGSQVGSGSGRLWATGAGVLLGGLLGSEIGASLDKADMAYAQQAQNNAMTSKVGETITWNNPQSGNSGTYTATRDGYSDNNRYCREYQQTINVGGRKETGYGTACQKPNGDWEIIN